MDWHDRTQRQVGAEGIEAVRHWLADAASSPPRQRPLRAHAVSVGVLLFTLVTVLVLAPGPHPATAAPLPPGDYRVTVGPGEVRITVTRDGSATVAADGGLVAVLDLDATGRALDEFEVYGPAGLYRIEIEVGPDGDHRAVVRFVDPAPAGSGPPLGGAGELPVRQAAAASGNEDVVLVVASCAPKGRQARDRGWPNHGTIVSRAASGLPLTALITDPATGTTTRIDAPLRTVEDAAAFCALAAELTAAVPRPATDDARSDRDVPTPNSSTPGPDAARTRDGGGQSAGRGPRSPADDPGRSARETEQTETGTDRSTHEAPQPSRRDEPAPGASADTGPRIPTPTVRDQQRLSDTRTTPGVGLDHQVTGHGADR